MQKICLSFENTHIYYQIKYNSIFIPLPSSIRSGHSFPPLSGGLVMYLTLNLVPEASAPLHVDQSDTIHGSGTEKTRLS